MAERDRPRVIAHRGFAGRYPENTLAAVDAALDAGADMIEVDVRPCTDGEVVVFHDEFLDARKDSRGITDRRGRVADAPCDAVLDAEVLDSGETIPRLTDVIDRVRGTGAGLNVELKHPGTPEVSVLPSGSAADRDARRRRWEPFVSDVLDRLSSFDGDVLLSSFHSAALLAARAVAPDVDRAVLFSRDPFDALETARQVEATALHPPVDYVVSTPDRRIQTPVDVVALAREDGLDVNVWTVRTWYEATACHLATVDGVIADYPDLFGWSPS